MEGGLGEKVGNGPNRPPGSMPAAGADAVVRARTRRLIMTGLTLGLLLASLDQTVVGTSMPRIVGELGGLDRFSWIFSAYMLAATIMIPLAGKMSDRFGRKPIFLFGMGFFLGGSMLSGISQDMNQLILCRAIQGFGGGAMFPVAVATVADLYPPSERGKLQGALGAVFSLTSIIGPFIGGYIVDHFSWRWVFYVNMPVGALAIAVTMVNFPSVASRTGKQLDYAGMASIIAFITSFLLITFWGGDTYAWDSLQIIGLVAICICALAALAIFERRALDPVLPIRFFRKSVYTFSCLSLMMTAMGLFGVIAFLPLFLQAVVGMSATYSGQVLVPLMITAMLGAIVSGASLKRTGYKVWLVIGPLISAAGLYLLSTLQRGSPAEHTIGYLLITGLGLGFTMSNYIVAGQNVVDRKDMGAASSTLTLFRAMGGTIGVTILGVVVNRRMTEELPKHVSPQLIGMLPATDINSIGGIVLNSGSSSLPGAVIDSLRDALGASIVYIFFLSMIIVLIAWALSLCIRSVPLKSVDEYMNGSKTGATAADAPPQAGPASPAPPVPLDAIEGEPKAMDDRGQLRRG